MLSKYTLQSTLSETQIACWSDHLPFPIAELSSAIALRVSGARRLRLDEALLQVL